MVLAKGLLAIGMKKGDTFCSFGSQGSDPVLLLIACASLGIKYTVSWRRRCSGGEFGESLFSRV